MATKQKTKLATKMFDQLNLMREIRGETLIEGEEKELWIKTLEGAPESILTTPFFELAENYIKLIIAGSN